MKTIKLWNGWRVNHNGEVIECNSPLEVWELLGWDIENDKNASECATEITRQMFCFGFVDLSKMLTKKGTLTIEAF